MRLAEVDLAALALNVAEQMRLVADDRGIELELSAVTKAVIRGDGSRLKQIIVNLLDNAFRFHAAWRLVILRTASDDSGSLLEVSDTGIGIPASAIQFVFDRFFRVDEARSREDGGAGLGLSIVKSIAALHGAEIELERQPRTGALLSCPVSAARGAGDRQGARAVRQGVRAVNQRWSERARLSQPLSHPGLRTDPIAGGITLVFIAAGIGIHPAGFQETVARRQGRLGSVRRPPSRLRRREPFGFAQRQR